MIFISLILSLTFSCDHFCGTIRSKRQSGATVFLGLKVGFLKGILAGQAKNQNGYGFGTNGIGTNNGGNPFLGRSRVTERTYDFVQATYDDEREREEKPKRTTPLPKRYNRSRTG